MLDWDLQITTLPNALEHLFAQGIVFSTDVLRSQDGERLVSDLDTIEQTDILTKTK